MPGIWDPWKGFEQRNKIVRFNFFLLLIAFSHGIFEHQLWGGRWWNLVGGTWRAKKISCHCSWKSFICPHVLGHGHIGGMRIHHWAVRQGWERTWGWDCSSLVQVGSCMAGVTSPTPHFPLHVYSFPLRSPWGQDTP